MTVAPSFVVRAGNKLNVQQVLTKLKINLPEFDRLLKQGQFPKAEIIVNGVGYWSERTVDTWIRTQPRP